MRKGIMLLVCLITFVIAFTQYGIAGNNGIKPIGSLKDEINLVSSLSFGDFFSERNSYELTFLIKNISQIELSFEGTGEAGIYMQKQLTLQYCFTDSNSPITPKQWSRSIILEQLPIVIPEITIEEGNEAEHFLHIKFNVPQDINIVQGTYIGTLNLLVL